MGKTSRKFSGGIASKGKETRLADPIVTPQNTLGYCSAVEKPAGDSVADHFRLFMIPGMDHCGLPAQTGRGITEAGFDPRPTARGYQPGVDGLRPWSACRADDIRSFDPSRELSKETPYDEREGLYCGKSCTRKSAGHCAESSPLPVTLGQSA